MLIALALMLQVFFTAPAQAAPSVSLAPVTTFAANQPAHCSTSFFGIPTWYKYLDLDSSCNVVNFQLLGQGTNSGLLLIVLAIIDILLRIAALVAVAFVIVGGFKYMTSQGEPAGTKAALQTVFGAVVGLIIAIMAAVIVAFIGNRIG